MEEYLLKMLLKFLLWLEDVLPDDLRLAGILIGAGAGLLGFRKLALFLSADERVACLVLASASAIVGAYIAFRRAVWKWQDKRAPVVNSFSLRQK